jgi:hypothetical protein
MRVMSNAMSGRELNGYHYQAIRGGIFGGFSDRAIGPGKLNDCRPYVDTPGRRVGELKGRTYCDGVIIRVLGSEIFSWFDGPSFNVFSHATKKDPVTRIRNLVDEQIDRLSDARRDHYGAMFGPHVIEEGSNDYDGDERDGTYITVPVLEIPTGRAGYHSERIHAFAHNLFERPALAARWAEMPGGELAARALKRWKNLSASQ